MEEEEGSFLRRPKRMLEEEEGPKCDPVWRKGYRVSPEEVNNTYKIRLPCLENAILWNVTVDGVVIRKEPGQKGPVGGALLLPPTERVAFENYLRAIPRLHPEQITQDGVYTWIMYDGGQFVATRVDTPFEVGTVHNSLALSVGAHVINGAGELKKNGSSIAFNLESGSFMKPWLRSKERDRYCPTKKLEDYVEDKIRILFPGAFYLGRSFITQDAFPITQDVLDVYLHAGFRVVPLTAENIQKCEEMATMP
uniref:Uncharacterized protein n=1 Tax=viral metagenome TaxID=1070528 RepID=A0A6C0J5H1_9ZZZZ